MSGIGIRVSGIEILVSGIGILVSGIGILVILVSAKRRGADGARRRPPRERTSKTGQEAVLVERCLLEMSTFAFQRL